MLEMKDENNSEMSYLKTEQQVNSYMLKPLDVTMRKPPTYLQTYPESITERPTGHTAEAHYRTFVMLHSTQLVFDHNIITCMQTLTSTSHS